MRAPRPLFALIAACLLGSAWSPAAAQPQPALDLAQSHWYAGRPAQALEVLQAALTQQPQQPKLRFALAWMVQEQGDWTRAEALLKALLEEYPDHAEAHNNLAVVLAQRGELDGALLALQRAVALQPGHAQAQENLGDLLLRLAQRAYAKAAQGTASRQLPAKTEQLNGLLRTLPAR